MNNFQLNNTSVYLGGQCKWDIVLGNYNGQLYVQGFQLTPLSDNVPYNKRGSVDHLNQDHSYTLKKYCKDIKENFWSIEPCLTQQVNETISNETVRVGVMDNSFIAGTRRSSCYPVYHKQYECLQPIWLEKLSSNQYLSFSFDLCSISNDLKSRTVLDSKSFTLSPINSTDKRYEFHNKFVAYFYDWLKSLHILSPEGNNKVLDVDLQAGTAYIDGVSTISGQKTNVISCDYICDNLLSYERPNIETDYILTSLFKSHNTITSQLFNFCFCFNLGDVINPFFINQLNGKGISLMCDAGVNGNKFERRTLYTNYQFIKKDIYNPYVFLDDMTDDGTGGMKYEYDEEYKYNGELVESDNINVLNYLQDYNDEGLKDLNKVAQHIIHWDFVDHNQDIFNLYKGYSGLSSFVDQWVRTAGDSQATPPTNTKYTIDLFDLNNINRVDVVSTSSTPNKSNGALNWINPAKIIVVKSAVQDQLFNKIKMTATSDSCILYNEGLWTLDKSKIKNIVTNTDLSKLRLSFIKVDSWSPDPTSVFGDWNKITSTSGVSILINSNKIGYDHYVVIADDIKYFTIGELLKINNVKFHNYIDQVNKIVKVNDNQFNFYGFGTEIEIGSMDPEIKMNSPIKQCYYKGLNKKTFPYRKCGMLSPCVMSDENFDLNYQYYQNIYDKQIYKFSDSDYYSFEYRTGGKNMILDVMSELNYVIDKGPNETRNIETLIKAELNATYHLEGDDELIDYIYKLYNVTFKYEYKYDNSLDYTTYNVKMILK